MTKPSEEIIQRLKKKASQSLCVYRLAGVALSKQGEILGFAKNSFRKDIITEGKYSGRHVEKALIDRYGSNIATILIMRIGKSGDILPIDPCPKCAKLAEKLGIVIKSIEKD
jgi:hypothetical protein